MVKFGQEKWFWSIWAGKTGFGRFWPGKMVSVDYGRKNWVLTEKLVLGSFGHIWVHLGLEIVFYFFDLNTAPRGIRTLRHESTECYHHTNGPIAQVKPGQAHFLLGPGVGDHLDQ